VSRSKGKKGEIKTILRELFLLCGKKSGERKNLSDFSLILQDLHKQGFEFI